MAKWAPCKRREFIGKLRKIGFEEPEPGGRHFYMRHGTFTLTLPNNPEYPIPQVKMLLQEIELGIKRKIRLEEWPAY
jgi:predicted RNA binding protein YcfA (HicA-like mRNA interferase family)